MSKSMILYFILIPQTYEDIDPTDSVTVLAALDRSVVRPGIWILATYDIVGHLRYRRSVTTMS